MNFNENLHYLLESSDIRIKELSAKTEISENTLKTYLRANSAEPKVTNAVKIAKALSVTVEQLASGDYKEETITPQQRKLLSRFEKLPPHEQKAVESLIEMLLQ